MASRVGRRPDAAGRDTGSTTTGVATAVLALLSAGTLAALGLVTTNDLRSLGPPSAGGGAAAVSPPSTVVFPPGRSHQSRPHKREASGGGPSAFPIQLPGPIQPPTVIRPVAPSGPAAVHPGAAPSPSAQGPGVPIVPEVPVVPVVPPIPEPDDEPEFSGERPEHHPQVKVLGEKKGKKARREHPCTPRGRARRPQESHPAAPPWSAAVNGPHSRPGATASHACGQPARKPSQEPTESDRSHKPKKAHGSDDDRQGKSERSHPSAKPKKSQDRDEAREHRSAKAKKSHDRDHTARHDGRKASRDRDRRHHPEGSARAVDVARQEKHGAHHAAKHRHDRAPGRRSH